MIATATTGQSGKTLTSLELILRSDLLIKKKRRPFVSVSQISIFVHGIPFSLNPSELDFLNVFHSTPSMLQLPIHPPGFGSHSPVGAMAKTLEVPE